MFPSPRPVLVNVEKLVELFDQLRLHNVQQSERLAAIYADISYESLAEFVAENGAYVAAIKAALDAARPSEDLKREAFSDKYKAACVLYEITWQLITSQCSSNYAVCHIIKDRIDTFQTLGYPASDLINRPLVAAMPKAEYLVKPLNEAEQRGYDYVRSSVL